MLRTSSIPRLVIAALKGGSGKTLLTVGLLSALRRRGLDPAAFKKGPDYIDAGWLGLAADGVCYNLDTFLFDPHVVQDSFLKRSLGKDVAIIEGNRGLYDGVDAMGSYSTAELAKLLKAPVVLIIDATKMTRTVAALVLGCQALDPTLDLRGVILNRVGGPRHERILREAIESSASVPVIGSVAKLALENFPQRHLGLLPLQEHPQALDFVSDAAVVVERSIDMDALIGIAGSAGEFSFTMPRTASAFRESKAGPGLRIGILRDSAFQFYYPENLEALEKNGARIIEISGLVAGGLPDLDGLYIGGGFPETHAESLADNRLFKKSLVRAVHSGLPVYAECGGLMYLSRSLRIDDKVYPMVGVFPVDTVLERKPQGLGYIRVEVSGANPFYPQGAVLIGHEFHYSSVKGMDEAISHCSFTVLRGHGMDGSHDGICIHNALGTYLHIHALGEPLWAEGMLNRAAAFRASRNCRAVAKPLKDLSDATPM